MTIAYWCVLIAGVLPYLAALYAKAGGSGGFGAKENHDPRAFLATLEGARKRAVSAQLNAFEVTPLFVCSRVIFTLCYIYDLATLRSVVWAVGMAIIVSLFVVSA
jgi:uncharacterized MAPEG superfamily protein